MCFFSRVCQRASGQPYDRRVNSIKSLRLIHLFWKAGLTLGCSSSSCRDLSLSRKEARQSSTEISHRCGSQAHGTSLTFLKNHKISGPTYVRKTITNTMPMTTPSTDGNRILPAVSAMDLETRRGVPELRKSDLPPEANSPLDGNRMRSWADDQLIANGRNTIVGLEPDSERFIDCRKRFSGQSNIEIFNTTSSEFRKANPEARFELILNSMVLQHVSTSVCEGILKDIHALLSADGVAIIATTQNCKELFTFQNSPAHQTRDKFDAYSEQPNKQMFGIPVRKFSKESFLSSLEENGLLVLHWGQFSYIRTEKVSWFAKQYNVRDDEIRNVGDSQYAIVRRK